MGGPVFPRRHPSDSLPVFRPLAPGGRRSGCRTGLGRQLAAASSSCLSVWVALGLLLTGAADVLNFVWRALLEPFGAATLATVGTGWWQRGISGSLAAVLVGALVWRLTNLYWNALMTAQPPEGRMALRRLYLYVATVLAAAITLVPVAMLLRLGVLFLFGGVDTGDIDIDDLTTPLGLLPVGALAWRWHWLQVSAEARRYGDSRESEFVRRLYYYAVAATGLLLLWIGLVDLVRALLDLAIIGSISIEKGFRAHQFSSGVSLIAVGAPVWSLHWRTAQRVAEQDNEAGRAERASWAPPRLSIRHRPGRRAPDPLRARAGRLPSAAVGAWRPQRRLLRRRDLGRPRARRHRRRLLGRPSPRHPQRHPHGR